MKMNRILITLALPAALSLTAVRAEAGCVGGAVVGGVGGHLAGHHALLGAAAGCAVGHHMAVVKRRRMAARAAPPADAGRPR